MFKTIFYYWQNNIDTPHVIAKFNLWFFINIRILKLKISKNIIFFIKNLNSLKLKTFNFFYKNLNFEYFYFQFCQFLFYFLILYFIVFYFI